MHEAAFTEWLHSGGQISIPIRLLQRMQILNIPPEKLGYLVLALAKSQEELSAEQMAQDRWLKWALNEGWAVWRGEGNEKIISFTPLWDSIFQGWKQSAKSKTENKVDFEYATIVQWLDKMRGSISTTLTDKRYIQEFNLKYGWSTEFIIAFLELFYEKTDSRNHDYYYMARKVYNSGIDTINGLISFMNRQDWTLHKVEEVKKYIGKGPVTLGEKELYLKWQNQWKLSHELILQGAKSMTRTNNPNFNYLDKILEDWWSKGIKEPAETEKLLKHRTAKASIEKGNNSKRRVAPVGNRDLNKILGID